MITDILIVIFAVAGLTLGLAGIIFLEAYLNDIRAQWPEKDRKALAEYKRKLEEKQ